MVQIDYPINKVLTLELIQEIASQPNLLNVTSSTDGASAVFSFDHTPAQALAFKKWLNTKINGIYNDSLSKYTNFGGLQLVHVERTKTVLTSIGTTFKNVFTDSDGVSFRLDTDVFDNIGLYCHWLKSGTGTQSLQVVDINTPANVIASIPNLVSGLNKSVTAIPAALTNTGNDYKIQVKSTVANDGPTFIGLFIYMK